MAKLVSSTYGEALFQIAVENNLIDILYEEVTVLSTIFSENPDFEKLLNNPRISRKEKHEILSTVFGNHVSETIMNFFDVVIEKGRIGEVDSIFNYFISQVKEYKKIGIVSVITASQLSNEQKKSIEKRLYDITKYEAFEMDYQIDQSLIGGMLIRIGDRVFDSSIKTKISKMKKDLLKIQL